jgi:hypothetical protein
VQTVSESYIKRAFAGVKGILYQTFNLGKQVIDTAVIGKNMVKIGAYPSSFTSMDA